MRERVDQNLKTQDRLVIYHRHHTKKDDYVLVTFHTSFLNEVTPENLSSDVGVPVSRFLESQGLSVVEAQTMFPYDIQAELLPEYLQSGYEEGQKKKKGIQDTTPHPWEDYSFIKCGISSDEKDLQKLADRIGSPILYYVSGPNEEPRLIKRVNPQ